MANNALRLEGWEVTSSRDFGDTTEVNAKYLPLPDTCPKCGVADRLYRHGTITVDYVDAPYRKRTLIHAEVQRLRCRECLATFVQPLPDMDTKRRMTKRCVEWIGEQGVPRTYAEIARDLGLDEKTVRSVCNEQFAARMANYKIRWTPQAIGIDELMLDGQMRCIFVDLGDRKPLDIIPTHRKADVAHWLSNLRGHNVVKAVSIDMSVAYRDVVKAVMPQAILIIDKFHVVRCANQALDRVRNRARHASKSPRRNPWRGQRLLRMRAHRLNPALQMEVEGITSNNPLVADAYACKEAFFHIWDAADREAAEKAFLEWETTIPESVQPEFGKVAGMIKRWRNEIFNYFDYPHLTNAFTENRNGIVKMANRAGRGYSFKAIRAKALLAKPLARLAECPTCEVMLPVDSFKTKAGAGLPDDLAVCGTCHVRFHTQPIFVKRAEKHANSTTQTG